MPTEPAAMTREHVETFIGHLLANWRPATASVRYRALQVWFKWLVERGGLPTSLMDQMNPPYLPK